MGLLENTIGAMIGRRMGGDDQGAAPSGGMGPYGPLAGALLAMLAAKAATGGFGDLGGLLGGGKPQTPSSQAPTPQSPPGGAPSQGGQFLPQAQPDTQTGAGGLLSGLGGLLNQFQQNGHGNVAQSWVGNGQNAPATSTQITQALGPDTIRELAQRLGLPEEEVASRLSQELPQVVDKLTPQGRLPTHDEASAWH